MSLNTPKGAKSLVADRKTDGYRNWLMVTTTAGDVELTDGTGTWTLSAVPVGSWIPCESFNQINSENTDAEGFLVA